MITFLTRKTSSAASASVAIGHRDLLRPGGGRRQSF